MDELEQLRALNVRLATERKSLVAALAAVPAEETLPTETLQRLAAVSAAGVAVWREISWHEPHVGWS